ncbi:MAG: sigma-54 dependent transcriptional regulator [Candidatus Eremiobacteraeota bacterium]|nr:sigma-54 dependent transcriptional regulator [Candidatus Eremiobacteraeota bacterium]
MSTEGIRIMVVDDALDTREVIERNLSSAGHRVYSASSVHEAIELLKATEFDLVITDLKMPRVSGLDLIRYVRENHRDMEIMMITGYPSIEGAVNAVKTGAEEYLAKPFTDEELFSAVGRLVERHHVKMMLRKGKEGSLPAFQGLIGESESMRKVFSVILKAAATSATVLVHGESGTGKELVARAIHYQSPRASSPFVPVNCGAIPETLMESELFGHVKGAFTGATESRAGFFQTADGGTIFLDEIGNTSPAMQARLLRVLQDGEVCMVGSSRPRKVDVRIVAATNKELGTLVQKSLFREDLFFRLNVVSIKMPPLRERGDDIIILSRHFARRFAREIGRKGEPLLSHGLLRVLRGYSWPGNVRELENIMQQLLVLSESDELVVPDLPAHMRYTVPQGEMVEKTLAELEHEHIAKTLAHAGGNKTRAAEILGIDRKTLREKLKKYGLEKDVQAH